MEEVKGKRRKKHKIYAVRYKEKPNPLKIEKIVVSAVLLVLCLSIFGYYIWREYEKNYVRKPLETWERQKH